MGEYFIRHFAGLNSEDHLVVVPEGLSRYYTQGVYGRVGASWMTKEDRLDEIADYVKYLTQLKIDIESKVEITGKRILLGFSQGAATASRWVNEVDMNFNQLILWSGVFPPDLKLDGSVFRKEMALEMVVGDEDEFVSEERLQENLHMMENLGLVPNISRFKGGHKILHEELKNLVERLQLT